MIAPHRRTPGFTLVELMFSMAIGSIVLLLAASSLGTTGEGYERVGGTVASEREARALMSQLTSDLSSALFQKDGVIEKSSSAWPVDRIGFLSLQPAGAQSAGGRVGDLCAVNYRIGELKVNGKVTRCLMRGFRESKPTFEALKNGTVASLYAEDEGADSGTTADEPVAFGVVAFEARPRSRDATGKWLDWVPNETTGPEAFDVTLVIARRDLAGRLRTSSDWDGAGAQLGSYADVGRNKNLEVYRATLRFGNHANP